MTIISRRGSRSAISLVAATAATLTLAPAALAAPGAASTVPTNARDCVEAKLVWVNVDFNDSSKPSKGGCATDFTAGKSTGIDVLNSAAKNGGFEVKTSTGQFGEFIEGIDGVAPVWTEENLVYWGYFNGTVAEDGSITYKASDVGASSFKPAAGSVEAWSVGDGNQEISLKKLPAAATENDFSSENSAALGIAGAIAAILAVVGGVLAALHAGIFTVPGWENFKH